MKRHFNCKLSILREKELINYYAAGNSLSKTGIKFGLSLTGVRKILNHYGVSCRTVSEAQTGVYYNTKESFFNSLKTDGDCLLWQGATSWGYGCTCYEGEYISTHRLAYILENGQIPHGKQVLHKCDVPLCCNPKHLFLGTHQINMKDRNRKGRAKGGCLKGEKNPGSKLTEADVLKIRQAYLKGEKQKDIAVLFGIHPATVLEIVKKKLWGHI